ncbi:hypothetical protein Barb6_00493 [Bacteroidales bacterium Barb6]|nr:hypothetical protein Barb6_00493 [Bacteroidales bacterium Barb6]
MLRKSPEGTEDFSSIYSEAECGVTNGYVKEERTTAYLFRLFFMFNLLNA